MALFVRIENAPYKYANPVTIFTFPYPEKFTTAN